MILAGIKGFQRGFVIEAFSLVAFFIGLLVALKLTFPIALRFFGDSQAFWIIALGTFFALFFLMIWAIKGLAVWVKKTIDFTLVGILDNLLGLVLSVIKWLFIFSICIWVMGTLELELPKRWIDESWAYNPIVSIGPVLIEVTSQIIPFFQDVIESMSDPTERI